MGSNGLTSARHDVFSKTLAQQYPESFDPNIQEQLVYAGQKSLTDVTDTPLNAGKLVLSPTRTYAPIIKAILNQVDRKQIHGMVHCSGGAQTKILHFIDKLHVIKENLFDTPPLFKLIQEQSGTDWKEMYQVFNMGHRMELYVTETIANTLISISQSFGVDAKVVGRLEPSTKKQLTILSPYGEFRY
jgi:phosphoribosylformylglycinamidine cyclo-ligase